MNKNLENMTLIELQAAFTRATGASTKKTSRDALIRGIREAKGGKAPAVKAGAKRGGGKASKPVKAKVKAAKAKAPKAKPSKTARAPKAKAKIKAKPARHRLNRVPLPPVPANGGPATPSVEGVGKPAKVGVRDKRIPKAGTIIVKEYEPKDKPTHKIKVKVVEPKGELPHYVDMTDGNKVYRSLSAIARAYTGVPWNGFAFFDLGAAV